MTDTPQTAPTQAVQEPPTSEPNSPVVESPHAPPDSTNVSVSEAASLPELPRGDPPRALVPGAFLKLQYEIKQVLARGMTNLYLADAGGGWGDSELKLIAEHAIAANVGAQPAVASVPAPSSAESTIAIPTVSGIAQAASVHAEPTPTNDALQLESGAMGLESLSDNPASELPPLPTPATPSTRHLRASSKAPLQRSWT
jgi:hypothetical protein